MHKHVYKCMYIYMYIHTYVCIYIYVLGSSARSARALDPCGPPGPLWAGPLWALVGRALGGPTGPLCTTAASLQANDYIEA